MGLAKWRAAGLDAIEPKTEDVRMTVNQAGQYRSFAQIDELRPGGNLYIVGWANGGDSFTFHQDDLVLHHSSGLTVK
jgi:hypothetical protein